MVSHSEIYSLLIVTTGELILLSVKITLQSNNSFSICLREIFVWVLTWAHATFHRIETTSPFAVVPPGVIHRFGNYNAFILLLDLLQLSVSFILPSLLHFFKLSLNFFIFSSIFFYLEFLQLKDSLFGQVRLMLSSALMFRVILALDHLNADFAA